ncbi:MAG: hypothetical protein A2147_10625 [Chloroflexi bacterium RBG_16_57_8]|nr:MAG: hypothetical protein A2147_10625 [Chloroflexi bacterium RBG_16_57_8]
MLTNATPAEAAKHRTSASTTLLVLAGPLIGLAYIIALPCIGAVLLVYFGGRSAIRGIARLVRRPAPRTITG